MVLQFILLIRTEIIIIIIIIMIIKMKYVQGNITNELITRSFKIKDIYNHDYQKPYFHGNKRISWPLPFL